MMKKYTNIGNKIGLVFMFGALTLLFVYLANVLDGLRVLFFFVSSIFVMGVAQEEMPAAAVIMIAAVFFIGMLILPVPGGMLPYLFFFGHYGLAKYYIERKSYGAGAFVIKMIYFNVCFFAMHYLAGGYVTALLPFELPLWALVVCAEVVFIVYDLLFSKLSAWYAVNMRNGLVAGRRY